MDFDNKIIGILNNIGISFHGTLATCKDNKVTARTISFIIINNKFYFQTSINSLKAHQMESNPNVAISYNSIQIEGISKAIGYPNDNIEFVNLFKEKYPNAYKLYTNLEIEVLYEVNPKLIKIYKYMENIPYIHIFDFINKTHEIIEIEYLK